MRFAVSWGRRARRQKPCFVPSIEDLGLRLSPSFLIPDMGVGADYSVQDPNPPAPDPDPYPDDPSAPPEPEPEPEPPGPSGPGMLFVAR